MTKNPQRSPDQHKNLITSPLGHTQPNFPKIIKCVSTVVI